MSYFQRLVAQSRSAAVPRPVIGGVRPAAGSADIDEIHVESDAPAQRTAATSGPAPADRTTAASGGSDRTIPSVPDQQRESAGAGDVENGRPLDRADAPPSAAIPDRRASVATTDASTMLPGDTARTRASIHSTASAPDANGDHVDVSRAPGIDDPAGDPPRPFRATPSQRIPAQPMDDPADSTASIRDASTTAASGMAPPSVPESGREPDRRQAIAAAPSEAPAGNIVQRAARVAQPASAMRVQIGRVASDPAPHSAAPRIEVRFGRVSVEVHAAPPPAPAPIAAPVVQVVAPAAAPAFAPSRHYLRVD